MWKLPQMPGLQEVAESWPLPVTQETFCGSGDWGISTQPHMHVHTCPSPRVTNAPNSQIQVLEPDPFLRTCNAPAPRAKDTCRFNPSSASSVTEANSPSLSGPPFFIWKQGE